MSRETVRKTISMLKKTLGHVLADNQKFKSIALKASIYPDFLRFQETYGTPHVFDGEPREKRNPLYVCVSRIVRYRRRLDRLLAEGVGVDGLGNVYGGVVRRQMLERHEPQSPQPTRGATWQ